MSLLTQNLNDSKKFHIYCKKDGHIIKKCPTKPLKRFEKAHIASVGSSSTGSFMDIAPPTQSALASVQLVTPEIIQQMIIYVFSALGLLGKPFSTSPP